MLREINFQHYRFERGRIQRPTWYKVGHVRELLIRWRSNNVEEIAYVINEIRNRFHLQTMGNETGTCSKLIFVFDENNNRTFDLKSVTDGRIGLRRFRIQEYRPIYIRLHWSNSIIQITTNMLVCNKGDNNTLILISNECT